MRVIGILEMQGFRRIMALPQAIPEIRIALIESEVVGFEESMPYEGSAMKTMLFRCTRTQMSDKVLFAYYQFERFD